MTTLKASAVSSSDQRTLSPEGPSQAHFPLPSERSALPVQVNRAASGVSAHKTGANSSSRTAKRVCLEDEAAALRVRGGDLFAKAIIGDEFCCGAVGAICEGLGKWEVTFRDRSPQRLHLGDQLIAAKIAFAGTLLALEKAFGDVIRDQVGEQIFFIGAPSRNIPKRTPSADHWFLALQGEPELF